jgi:hypothetical protein
VTGTNETQKAIRTHVHTGTNYILHLNSNIQGGRTAILLRPLAEKIFVIIRSAESVLTFRSVLFQHSPYGIFSAESTNRTGFLRSCTVPVFIIITTTLHVHSISPDGRKMRPLMVAIRKEIFSPLEKINSSKSQNSFQGRQNGRKSNRLTFVHKHQDFPGKHVG